MTFLVANVQPSNSIEYWRQRTNDLINAVNNYVLTVAGGNSSPAIGNAYLFGNFQSNNIVVPGTLSGGQINSPGTLNISSILAVSNVSVFGSTSSDTYVLENNSYVAPPIQVPGMTSNTTAIAVARYDANSFGPVIIGAKSRSAAVDTNLLVSNNDVILTILGEGDDGTKFVPAASIRFEVDGTPAYSSMPGRIVFSTTANLATTTTERIRIENNGMVGINNTNPNYTLDVGGDINFTGTLRNNGNFFSQGATGNTTTTNKIFYENDQTVTGNYSITPGKNAMTAGPITINAGIVVTIPTGSTWSVV